MRLVPIVLQQNEYSCGEAVVDSMLRHHGSVIKNYKFASEIDGTSPRVVEHQLRIQGFKVLAGNFTWELVKYYLKRKMPVIVCKDGHWVILTGVINRKIIIMDPKYNYYVYMSIIMFRKEWEDYDTVGSHYLNWGIVAYG